MVHIAEEVLNRGERSGRVRRALKEIDRSNEVVEHPEMTVVKRVSFDAAHYLPKHEGKCSRMHGHHWVVELGVKGPVTYGGMVIDFTILKGFLELVEDKFDHTCLNDTIINPTAESICLFIRDWFLDWWVVNNKGEVKFDFIKLWETGDSYALLKGS